MIASLKQRVIDLHNYRLFEAEIKICGAIEEAWAAEEEALLFIHGYHNGVAIKSFIRDPKGLKAILSRDFPELPEIEIEPKDEGSTYVVFTDEGCT